MISEVSLTTIKAYCTELDFVLTRLFSSSSSPHVLECLVAHEHIHCLIVVAKIVIPNFIVNRHVNLCSGSLHGVMVVREMCSLLIIKTLYEFQYYAFKVSFLIADM